MPRLPAHATLWAYAGLNVYVLVFRCKVTGGQLTTNNEVTAFRWADETHIHQLTSQSYAARFLDALRQDPTPASGSTTEPTSSTNATGRLRQHGL